MSHHVDPPIEEADANATVAGLAADPTAVLVDVREPEEWREGHAPAARHLPMRTVPDELATLPRDAPIYLVCRSGSRSHTVAAYLRDAGFRRPINVAGGMIAWARAGLPVER